MYETILRPAFFRFDPERVHDRVTGFGEFLGSNFLTRWIVALFCDYRHASLETTVAGVHFRNPIGLGAGFDKDMRLTKIMPAVGFGFMEVGAITHFPYAGNNGLRLARLPDDKALLVNYGLKNEGAEAAAQKLKALTFSFPVGINIAKTNRADIKGAASIEDYVATYRMLARRFAYVTINISCPNAQDGCTFQDPVMLNGLLRALSKEEKPRPVFLKISAHLSRDEVDAIIAVAGRYRFVDGFVVANLAKDRSLLRLHSSPAALDAIPAAGVSGAPMRRLSTEMIRHIYRTTKGRYVLIGLGGVFTAEDAYEKIKAGASLVQMVTGLIYGGPMAVRRINRGLVELLARDGYATVAEAVGKGAETA